MEKEFRLGKMDRFTEVNGKIIKSKEKVNFYGLMVINIQVIGKMIKEMVKG